MKRVNMKLTTPLPHYSNNTVSVDISASEFNFDKKYQIHHCITPLLKQRCLRWYIK